MPFPRTRRRRRRRRRRRCRRWFRCFLRRACRQRCGRFRAWAGSPARRRAYITSRSDVVGLLIAISVGEEGARVGGEVGGRVAQDGLWAAGEVVFAVDLGVAAVGGGGAGPEVDMVFVGGVPVFCCKRRRWY